MAPESQGIRETRQPSRLSAQALRLQYLTIGWNVVEGVLCVAIGYSTSGLSLLAFGVDSFIEVSASLVMVWRLLFRGDARAVERVEKRARRLIGASFFALGAFVAYEAIQDLALHLPPERTIAGIVIAALSATVMPLLGRAKRRIAVQLNMSSLASESAQTSICGYLSLILLTAILLYSGLGWWWADAAGAILMVPIIMREGVESFRSKECCCP